MFTVTIGEEMLEKLRSMLEDEDEDVPEAQAEVPAEEKAPETTAEKPAETTPAA